jgi:polyisoprenoid-binding protein YceI
MESSTDARVCFTSDKRASQFTVQAFAAGMISSVAHSPKIAIRDWTAEITFEPVSLRDAVLRVWGKTTSFDVLDEMSDSDRRNLLRVMNNEVLETDRFSDFSFESSSILAENQGQYVYRVSIEGKLKLHGVTSTQSITAKVAFGVDSVRAYGEFTLLQTDYGIKIASIAGGTLKLQDELKSSFYLVARKVTEEEEKQKAFGITPT